MSLVLLGSICNKKCDYKNLNQFPHFVQDRDGEGEAPFNNKQKLILP